MSAITTDQIRIIHVLKGKAKLGEDAYRDLLAGAGVASSKQLSSDGANALINRLRVITGDVRDPREGTSRKAQGALNLQGPFVAIIRALWIDAYELGVVEQREDTALVAFVRRQTGIAHLNWVRDPEDSRKVIEALKGWMAREAHVEWKVSKLDRRSPAQRVLDAQLKLLWEPPASGSNQKIPLPDGTRIALDRLQQRMTEKAATPAEITRLIRLLGAEIRKRKGVSA